jgi:MerR family transcriptional regulator, copper efflux regulator
MSKDLTIGKAAKAVGLSVDAVRFYERQGMAPPPRRAGGRRAYGPQQMLELTFMRAAGRCGCRYRRSAAI